MPRKMPPRSSSSPPPPRAPLTGLDLGIDWNPSISPAFQTPQLTFSATATSLNSNKRASRAKEKSEKSGVVAAWEEIRIHKSGAYTRDKGTEKIIQDFTENTGLGGKLKKNRKEGKKPGKRTVSLQLLPSSSTWSNLGLGNLRRSWTGGASSEMKNLTAMIEEENKGNNKPEERKSRSMKSRLRAVSESKSTVGFGYEMWTPPIKATSQRGRAPHRPGESWLDLDDTPVSTLGKADGGAAGGIRIPLSTFVTAPRAIPPPVTPPPPQPHKLKALIQTHLTTTLLSLEIDIAQLDTRLFLIFDQLRTVHTALLLRTPGISSSNNTPTLKRISNEEAKSRLQDSGAGLAALEKQISGYFEMVGVVEMQIGEALIEEDYIAEGFVEEIGADTLRGAVELRRQIGQVRSELIRVERKRKGLADWAGEVSIGWGVAQEEEEKEQARAGTLAMSPKTHSAPATPVKKSSLLAVSPPMPSQSTSQLLRHKTVRGSRSMVTITSKQAPNVNKPLPASPGDGDFAMETRYVRSRSKSPAPPMRRDQQGDEIQTRQTREIRTWETTLLPPSPSSPPPPSIPPRNPRRIVPRTAPPHHAEPEIGLAMSMPPLSPPPLQQRCSVTTEETRLSLDLAGLDRLLIPQRNISRSRSPREVYEDFFSMYEAGDEDEDSMSRYSQDEHQLGEGEYWSEEDGYEHEETVFELPPLLPSIGPDSVFSGSNKSNNSNNEDSSNQSSRSDKNRFSVMTSTPSESTSPTTPCSTSNSPTSSLFSIPMRSADTAYSYTTAPTTPYTPFTPTFNIHRKPLPPASGHSEPVPFTTAYSNATIQRPTPILGSIPTPGVSPKMMCSNFGNNNPTSIITTTAAFSSSTNTSMTTTPTTPVAAPMATLPTPTTASPTSFQFYSPSSFPHPPALNEVERKVKRESMLRVSEGGGGSEYPEMEIELLQCPPRGKVFGESFNTYIPPTPVVEVSGTNGGGMRGRGLLKKLKRKSDKGSDKGSTDASAGVGTEWAVDQGYKKSGYGYGQVGVARPIEGDGESKQRGFWKGRSSATTSTGVKIFAV